MHDYDVHGVLNLNCGIYGPCFFGSDPKTGSIWPYLGEHPQYWDINRMHSYDVNKIVKFMIQGSRVWSLSGTNMAI